MAGNGISDSMVWFVVALLFVCVPTLLGTFSPTAGNQSFLLTSMEIKPKLQWSNRVSGPVFSFSCSHWIFCLSNFWRWITRPTSLWDSNGYFSWALSKRGTFYCITHLAPLPSQGHRPLLKNMLSVIAGHELGSGVWGLLKCLLYSPKLENMHLSPLHLVLHDMGK